MFCLFPCMNAVFPFRESSMVVVLIFCGSQLTAFDLSPVVFAYESSCTETLTT